MNLKEIENVSKLEPQKRYQYFIKKIADFEELWTITDNEGYYVINEIDGKLMFSLWPQEEYVKHFLKSADWSDCEICSISLEELESDIYKFIEKENFLVNVFPVNGKSGFVVNLEELKRDLALELDKFD